MRRAIVCLIVFLSFSSTASADNRMSGADGLEQAYKMLQLMRDARYELMTLWIECELDNLCVCENKEVLYEKTRNFALKVMIETDREQDAILCERMKEDATFCRVPMIQAVNKAMIPCYMKFRDSVYYNEKEMYNEGTVCLAEQLQPLVAKENPYAMYVFVDYLSNNKDKYPGMINFYQKKLDALKDTQEFKLLEQCHDYIKN